MSTQVKTLNAKIVTLDGEIAMSATKVTALDAELAKARGDVEARESELSTIKEAKTLMKTKLDQAETKASKITQQLKGAKQDDEKRASEAETTLNTLRNQVAALTTAVTDSSKRLAEAEATLNSSDIQTVIQVRQASIESFAALQVHVNTAFEHSQAGLKVASEHMDTGMKLATEHYDSASKEAERMYSKAAPVVEEYRRQGSNLHQQVLEAAAPHIETASGHFTSTQVWLESQITVGLVEASKSVPEIKPHTSLAAKILSKGVVVLPFAILALIIYLAIVRRVTSLMLKLEYMTLFVLLGVVLSITTLAFVTDKDPIAALKNEAPQMHLALHQILGGLSLCVSACQFSVFLAGGQTGKGRVSQLMSLVAGLMNGLLMLHYYNLAYLKAETSPSFSMSFQIKGDGGASFAEYTIFTCSVVLVAALATPAGFRFSALAFIIALEGAITGFCIGLVTVDAVFPAALTTLLKAPHADAALLGVVGVLQAMLALRLLTGVLFGASHSHIAALGHMLAVGYIFPLYPTNAFVGLAQSATVAQLTKIIMSLGGLSLLQLLTSTYITVAVPRKQSAKAVAKAAAAAAKTVPPQTAKAANKKPKKA